ncbi:hypothetical protein [Dysgonomonas macrotermitis]|uniref:Lipocalin-like domain-containing protein n=1 Tax=Dysgonomonas macrotermitis TaxID=1346286 RepID=A0A1M5C2T3_9BACT|nr:hypothetical protein [Dysgonomonas macrotermitis]SHF49078.1 hypothetical protein SAMN05444362_10710 [Dysgonomonas macrotermitis]
MKQLLSILLFVTLFLSCSKDDDKPGYDARLFGVWAVLDDAGLPTDELRIFPKEQLYPEYYMVYLGKILHYDSKSYYIYNSGSYWVPETGVLNTGSTYKINGDTLTIYGNKCVKLEGWIARNQ